ncbi:MAG: hypothetical protein LAP40_22505 [Acidobacteriia bacterium]|nr:hypothetical protein [Terriglobia bacterium]
MHGNDEMSIYLDDLLEHERACEVENCALCQSAQSVYRLVRNLVFSEVVYPDVAIAAQGRVSEVGNPAAGSATFSTPLAA